MPNNKLNRRGFMKQGVGAAVIAGVSSLPAQAKDAVLKSKKAASRPIALGGPMFVNADDLDAYAKAHRDIGYAAAYCPHANAKQTDRLAAIKAAFTEHNVVLAEVGRWCNLLEADATKRKANMDNVIDGLAVADATGTLCCVNIAGSYNTEVWYGPHPKNLSQEFFDATVENARKIIDTVKPKQAKLAFEMTGWSWPDSPDAYLKLIQAIDRKGFGVHLDVCNLINCPTRFYDNTALINECFDKLGPHILSCHAKDLQWPVEMNIHFKEVPAGSGKLDYKTHLRRLAALPRTVPLMLEHCADEAEYTQARKYLLNYGPKVGVAFA